MQNVKQLTKQDIFDILSSRIKEEKKLLDIPLPELLHDGVKAAKIIKDTIKSNKKIVLIGDYDVDGVSSCAIVVEFFRLINYPLEVVIPNRFRDGYGLSASVLDRVEADLIVTVDNGISAFEAADICRQREIELIITDHHTPPEELPSASAIVNPKLSTCNYPFKEICGAEVIWLVLALLKKELGLHVDMREFIDIVAIATIADIMPLIHINRAIVKDGLRQLAKSKRASSVIIRDFLNKKRITSEDIAFSIAPRLNSAGRMDEASLALEFLTARDTYEAFEKFEKLNALNESRKEMESFCTAEAIKQANKDDDIIVVAHKEWHEGVVGIVASRLSDKLSKPTIALSINADVAKGSARSVGSVDIYSLIKSADEFLLGFGGHKMAAGLSLYVKDINSFSKKINQNAKNINRDDFMQNDNILGILPSNEIDFELLDLLEQFEPYGEANEKPLFLIKDATVLDVSLFGRDKNHSKIKIIQQNSPNIILELIYFKNIYKIPKNGKLSCLYTISKNVFNNQTYIQLLIRKIL